MALHPDVLRVNHVGIEAIDLRVEPSPHPVAILSELPIGERGKRRLLAITLRRAKAGQLEGQVGLDVAGARHDAIDFERFAATRLIVDDQQHGLVTRGHQCTGPLLDQLAGISQPERKMVHEQDAHRRTPVTTVPWEPGSASV